MCPLGHVRASERVPEAASGWLRVSPFLLITTSLLLVPQVYVSPQNMVAAWLPWPGPRPRFNCGLALLGVVMSPARAPPFGPLLRTKNLVLRGPRGRIARNSVKNQFNCPSGRRIKVASASGLTDQETQGAGWCIRGSTFPVCFFFSFFFLPFLSFCPTAALHGQ